MPVRWVEFRRGFWIATTEITNAQYERFRPRNGRSESSKGDDSPVVDISWEDAKAYCAWLAEKSGRPIRLPSEAEWECACRAGSDGEFTFGDDEENLSEFAWYDENSEGRAHAVGTKRPNRWGLFDLHGNIWEWCEDTWHTSYDEAPADGSPWTEGGVEVEPGSPFRVFRGGGWGFPARYCRSAFRSRFVPALRYWLLGFRPAFVPLEN
jgi:formylglycine-generating enzyme required for sulfatase activity